MNKSKPFAAFIAFIALVVMLFICLKWPDWRDAADPKKSIGWAQGAWLITVGCLVVFLMAVSVGVTQRPLGFLINERNLMSLTRFQTVFWTVIILSAFLVVALTRVVSRKEMPLEIAIDPKLWTLLGISLTSLVGTSLINSTKTNKDPDTKEVEKTAKALVGANNAPKPTSVPEPEVEAAVANAKQTAQTADTAKRDAAASPKDSGAAAEAVRTEQAAKTAANVVVKEKTEKCISDMTANKQGTLYANASIEQAAFSDMFEGDEVGNAAYIDLAKVQMFFFTIISGASYVFLLLSETLPDLTMAPENVKALPVLSAGMIALLGISHAGHLAGRATDRTKLQT